MVGQVLVVSKQVQEVRPGPVPLDAPHHKDMGYRMRNFGGLLKWCPRGTGKLVLGPLLGPSLTPVASV
jgi:hypothetical protein